MAPERVLPWYFLAANERATVGCGGKTNPGAFCFWQTDPAGVSCGSTCATAVVVSSCVPVSCPRFRICKSLEGGRRLKPRRLL